MNELALEEDEVAGRAQLADPGTGGARTRLSTTSEAMRVVGAALLVASASTFMLQHWEHGSSVLRYSCLLGQTILLAVAGFVCGLHVRESRAARTFLGLVLACVPVHFAVLGGVLRSAWPLDHAHGPNDLWAVSSPLIALGLIGTGLCVIGPLALLASTALCRPHAKQLARAALLANAFVLLPIRAPNAVAVVCGAMLCVLFALDARLAGLGYAIRTPGARFARAMLLAPIAVVVGRTLLFYEPTMFAYGAFAFCAGIALFFVAPRALGETVACALLRAAATMGASLGALLMFAHFLFSSPYPLFALLVLPPAATTAALSFFAGEQDSWYRLGAALFACAGLSANTLFCWDFDHLTAAGSIALVAGIAVLLLGFSAGQRLVFACGAATALLGFFQVMAAAIELESLKNWGALSLMGVSLIFTAALVERHAGRLLRYGRALRARLNAW